jgi:hypothetical protein
MNAREREIEIEEPSILSIMKNSRTSQTDKSAKISKANMFNGGNNTMAKQ